MPFGTIKFVKEVCKILVRSNIVAVTVAAKITEDLVVNITSTKEVVLVVKSRSHQYNTE